MDSYNIKTKCLYIFSLQPPKMPKKKKFKKKKKKKTTHWLIKFMIHFLTLLEALIFVYGQAIEAFTIPLKLHFSCLGSGKLIQDLHIE